MVPADRAGNLLLNYNNMQGKIKRLNEKRFGFIVPEDGGKDLFFHANDLVGTRFEDLKEGDDVTFDIKDTPKGPAAINIAKI